MAYVVQAPGNELRRLAVRLEWAFVVYLRSRGMSPLDSQWEAPRHAWTLSGLVLRHAEATTLMARTDVSHAPTAWVTARSCVETAARCLWMLASSDEWEREARWIAFLREGARLGKQTHVGWLDMIVDRSRTIEDFAAAVEAKLPAGVEVPKRIPATHEMLAPIDPALDAFYAVASQFTHGAEFATGMFRFDLGVDAKYGDASHEGDWIIPLTFVWLAYQLTLNRLIELTGAEQPDRRTLADQQVDEAFASFKAKLGPLSE